MWGLPILLWGGREPWEGCEQSSAMVSLPCTGFPLVLVSQPQCYWHSGQDNASLWRLPCARGMFISTPSLYWCREDPPPSTLVWQPKTPPATAKHPLGSKSTPLRTAARGCRGSVHREWGWELYVEMSVEQTGGAEAPKRVWQLRWLQTWRPLEWMSQKKEQNPKSWFNLILLFEQVLC